LVLGGLAVGNTMIGAVLERRAEIGVRKAVGAGRMTIAGQFLIESMTLGGLGGVLGLIVGVDAVAVICLVNSWLVVVPPMLLAAAPATGVVVGALAGAYPAYLASAVPPAVALRG
jgi:putative ABC transport system permease protein